MLIAAVALPAIISVISDSAPASAAPISVQGNLGTNGSFEWGSPAGWGPVVSGVGIAAYNNRSQAHGGAWSADMVNRTKSRAGVRNDYILPTPSTAGDSYSATVWLKAGGGVVSGQTVLWAIGRSPTEASVTTFTVGTTWTRVQVPLDTANSGHTRLSLQVESQPGVHLGIDDAVIVRDLASNGSFERGSPAGWGPVVSGVGIAAYNNRSQAHGGAWSADMVNRTKSRAGVRNDYILPTPSTAGDSYSAAVWLKAGGGVVSGQTVLWAIGRSPTEASVTTFTVGTTWTRVQVPLDTANSGHTRLSLQVESQPGVHLGIDDAVIVRDLASNGSFERGSPAGWGPVVSGVGIAAYNNRSQAHGGAWSADMVNRTKSRAGVRNDYILPTPSTAGDSYSAAVWLKAGGGVVSGQTVLWAIGRSPTEASVTTFTVGTTWTRVQVPLDTANSGHTRLSLQVESQPGVHLGIDDAVIGGPAAAPTTLGSDIVAAAESEIGYQDEPVGTFCNAFSTYWGAGGSCSNGYRSEEWCADFAAWAWRRGGAQVVYSYASGDLNGAAASFYRWGIAHRTWHAANSGYTPRAGDVVIYGLNASGSSADHVAVVTNVIFRAAGPNVVNGDWWSSNDGGVVAEDEQTTATGSDTISGYVSPTPA